VLNAVAHKVIDDRRIQMMNNTGCEDARKAA